MNATSLNHTWEAFSSEVPSFFRLPTAAEAGVCIIATLLTRYIYLVYLFHRAHGTQKPSPGQIPPEYPFLLPHLSAVASLWQDHAGFLRQLTYVKESQDASICYP
jgi:hypothetical protein